MHWHGASSNHLLIHPTLGQPTFSFACLVGVVDVSPMRSEHPAVKTVKLFMKLAMTAALGRLHSETYQLAVALG